MADEVGREDLQRLEKKLNGYRDASYITMRDYFESRLAAIEQEINRRFDAIERDTNRALDVLDERFAKANEIRGALDDQARTFVKTSDHENLKEQVKQLQINEATLAGKASVEDMQDARDEAISADSKAVASQKAADEAHQEAVSARRIAWAGVVIAALTSIIIAIVQAI